MATERAIVLKEKGSRVRRRRERLRVPPSRESIQESQYPEIPSWSWGSSRSRRHRWRGKGCHLQSVGRASANILPDDGMHTRQRQRIRTAGKGVVGKRGGWIVRVITAPEGQRLRRHAIDEQRSTTHQCGEDHKTSCPRVFSGEKKCRGWVGWRGSMCARQPSLLAASHLVVLGTCRRT